MSPEQMWALVLVIARFVTSLEGGIITATVVIVGATAYVGWQQRCSARTKTAQQLATSEAKLQPQSAE